MHEWSGKWCWMIIPIHHHPFARETFTRLSECDSPRPMVTEFQIAILADGPKLVLCGLLVKEFVNLLWTNISSWVYNYNLHGLYYILQKPYLLILESHEGSCFPEWARYVQVHHGVPMTGIQPMLTALEPFDTVSVEPKCQVHLEHAPKFSGLEHFAKGR